MPCWDVDTNSKMILPLEEALSTSGVSEIVGVGASSTNNPTGGTTVVAGPGGSNARSFTNLGGGWSVSVGSATNLFDKVTSAQWTIDALMIQTTTPATVMRFDFRASGTVILALDPQSNGTIETYIETTSRSAGAGFDGYTPTFFPRAGWQHVRAIIDYTAATFSVYTAPAGTIPTLFYSLNIDTNTIRLPITSIQIGQGTMEGIGRIRISTGTRTDSFPVIGTPLVAPTITSAVQGSGATIALTFSKAMVNSDVLNNPSTYTLTTVSGTTASVSSVTVVSPTAINLNLSPTGNFSGVYTIGIGSNKLLSTDGASLASYTSSNISMSVTGINPVIVSASSSSNMKTVTVTFSKAVTAATATVASNYTISGGVIVSGVVQVSPTTYILTTLNELPATTYTVSPSSNIVDLLGNPVS